MSKLKTISHVSPLSLGKILGLLYLVLGLLMSIGIFVVQAFSPAAPDQPYTFVALLGVGLMLTVGYALLGYIAGIITGALYNLIAKYAGGLRVTIE